MLGQPSAGLFFCLLGKPWPDVPKLGYSIRLPAGFAVRLRSAEGRALRNEPLLLSSASPFWTN